MGKQLRFWAAAITAIGFMFGVIGCSTSEEKPSPIPSTAPPPVSQTPSPSPSPPSEVPMVETVRPDIDIPEPKKYPEMANDDIEGASTAARYFLDLYGYVYNTGDLKAWNKISDPKCEICSFVAEDVEKEYSKGNWFENYALLHGQSTVYYPTDETPYYLVVVDVQSTEYMLFDNAGVIVELEEEWRYPKYAIGVNYISPSEWKVVEAAPRERTK